MLQSKTKFRPVLLLLLSAVLLWNCTSKSKSKEQTDNTEQTETREPTDDEIQEIGRVVDIEDGAYPMFSVTIDFTRIKLQYSFGFNVEESPLDVEGLYALKDKDVKVYYTSELENLIVDIVYECESLLGEDAPDQLEEGTKEVTGILSGAESLSGDLPSEITVTPEGGEGVVIKEFITEEMTAVNGKEVTIYYYSSGVTTITYLEELKD